MTDASPVIDKLGSYGNMLRDDGFAGTHRPRVVRR
jgi:hypothetical protein